MRVALVVLFARLSAGAVVYVDADAGGLNTGSSWTDAFTDLQDALTAAVSGDEIWVAEGTYIPTVESDAGVPRSKTFALVPGVAVYGGFAGTESARAERDWVAYETILSGDLGTKGDYGDNCYHVLLGADGAVLDGFTVAGGNANEGPPRNCGAGMLNAGCSPTVANCTFSGNRAYAGGGMCNDRSSATVTNCAFSRNSADFGGGMYSGFGSCSVTSTAFSLNKAESGGGMYNWGASLVVRNCTFFGNTADFGGGISDGYDSSSSITNCTFSGNSARDSGGGMRSDKSSCTITNCILWDNSAPTGPEIYIDAPSACIVSCSDVAQVDGFTDGGGNVNADPLFVVAALGDLHLHAGSPCIDAGDGDAAPAQDKDGNGRQDDTGTADTGSGAVTYADMGAYEFQGATPAEWAFVIEPHPGVARRAGADREIRWATSTGVTDVKIELSRDGGAGWETITGSTPNDGGHTWTVTDGGQPLPQRDCVVRLSDALDGDPGATSGTFAIFGGVWHVDVDAPAGGDGFSWGTALQHPQDAVDAASAGDEVWVAEGSYLRRDWKDAVVLAMKDGVSIYGGFAGTEAVRDDRDWAAHETILDGEGASDHVVVGGSDASFDGFAVTGGDANGDYLERDGGGMYNYGCSALAVSNCSFSGNSAYQYGGGMYNCCFSVSVTNCVFLGNVHGGISNGGGSPVVIGCAFSNNTVFGGMRNFGSSPSVIDCTFLGNTAVYGGGMSNYWDSSPTVRNCTFFDNKTSARGGAIYSSDSSPALANCTFAGNSAGHAGGAVFNWNSASTANNCIFWGDSAPNMPEIYSDYRSSCIVTNSCVRFGYDGVGNVDGDPLFVDAPSGDLRLSAGSPCIDSADGDAAPVVDKDGNARHDDPGLSDTGIGSPTYADMGAYEFQGSTPGSWIKVYVPRAGAAWRPGSGVAIRWLTTGGILNVEVELSRDGGVSWETVASVASNDRVYAWTVTDGGQPLPQENCIIRLSDALDGDPGATSGTFAIFGGVWHVDVDAPAGGDGFSWGTALQHPQDAVDAASAGDEVWVAEGTYVARGSGTTALAMRDGVALYGGFAGTEAGRDERDWTTRGTVLDGEYACYHVVFGASDARLDGFTVTRGISGDHPDWSGGGMYNFGGTDLTIANCTFSDNTGSRHGGGMCNDRFRRVTVENSTFLANVCDYEGGGIYGDGPDLVVTDCSFSANVSDAYGGGIYAAGGSISGCTFSGNTARYDGGGMFMASSCTLANCTFLGNSADDGGGVYCGYVTSSFTNCTFFGNRAEWYGGGIDVRFSNSTLTNCILWGNEAYSGQQIFRSTSSPTVGHCNVQGGYAGVGNIDADPVLVDAANGDLRLRAGSPCIDCADGDAAPATDMDGNPRHDDPGMPNVGTGVVAHADMGAYEFQGDTPPTGTVTGTVLLEDGADPASVTITTEGQTASATVVGNSIEYTITDVTRTTTGVNVETAEPGYTVTGSPAPITWVGTEGAATELVVRRTTATPFGGGCASGAPGAALALCVLIPCLVPKKRRRRG